MRTALSFVVAVMLGSMLSGPAKADVGVGLHPVPLRFTLIVEGESPEVAVFLVFDQKVRRVLVAPAEPVEIGVGEVRKWWFVAEVFVVPVKELAEFETGASPETWFRESYRGRHCRGVIKVRAQLDVFDDRDLIEQTYRLHEVSGLYELDLIHENQGSVWARWLWGTLCCVLPPVALVVSGGWFGLLLIRRANRRRRSRPGPDKMSADSTE